MFLSNLLEYLAVIFGILFVIYIVKEKRIGWLFGLLSSVYYLYFYFTQNVYLQVFLYTYYCVVAIYGFIFWKQAINDNSTIIIKEYGWLKHFCLIVLGIVFATVCYLILLNVKDSNFSLLDSLLFSFAIIATFLQVNKVRSNWIYFIIINFIYTLLMILLQSYVLGSLFVLYILLSVYGFIKWKNYI